MRRVETYIIQKVAIALARDCIIEPQKNVTDYKVDSVFVIRDKDFDNILDICLETDENGHNSYARGKKRKSVKHSPEFLGIGLFGEASVEIQPKMS